MSCKRSYWTKRIRRTKGITTKSKHPNIHVVKETQKTRKAHVENDLGLTKMLEKDAFMLLSGHDHKYSRFNGEWAAMNSHHSAPKGGSYIHWKAFSAFWISGWICALSHLTLCSLREKRQKEKKGLATEGRMVKTLQDGNRHEKGRPKRSVLLRGGI